MTLANFPQWLHHIALNALQHFHREIVILQGSSQWANTLLTSVESYDVSNEPSVKQAHNKTWYVYHDNDAALGNVNKHTYRNKLGTESHFVVFYSDDISIDALAALSGTLVAGGVLIFVLPSNVESSSFVQQSYFNTRFIKKLFAQPRVSVLTEEAMCCDEVIEDCALLKSDKHQIEQDDMGCLTSEQRIAVCDVIQAVKGHRNRPLILTADRGRGKSSALAIACAYLLDNSVHPVHIAITATHQKSLQIFFQQLAHSVKPENIEQGDVVLNTTTFEHKNGRVEFVAVDELIKQKATFHLVIVDEAASIPLYRLNQLLNQYHRLVFSSTVHGYEGAGRSFALKFKKNVAAKYPEYKTLHIKQPIRWAEDDPLEAFMYDLCLLNAELPQVNIAHIAKPIKDSEYCLKVVTAELLSKNESLLQQIFAVLVTAHYQTSPNDLQLLLDNSNVTIITFSRYEEIVGVALLLNEGKEEQHNIELIKSNQRRLKDQFIPQSLLTHCGEENSFNYSYLRIMRIAVVPELQGQGIGSLFLSRIEAYAEQRNIDFIGTSFGVNQQLLHFWQLQAYKIARIGFTKDKASGEHSALLLKPINKKNHVFVDNIEQAFYQSFDYLLAEQYKGLLPALVWQIMRYCPTKVLPQLTHVDLKAVEDFYTKKRQYSTCVYSLHKWWLHQMKKPLDRDAFCVISKIFQRQEVSYIVEEYGFTGKKAFNQHLVQLTQHYYK